MRELMWDRPMVFHYAMFAFDANALFVVYSTPLIPSHSVWMVPRTWEDCT